MCVVLGVVHLSGADTECLQPDSVEQGPVECLQPDSPPSTVEQGPVECLQPDSPPSTVVEMDPTESQSQYNSCVCMVIISVLNVLQMCFYRPHALLFRVHLPNVDWCYDLMMMY